MYYVVDKQMCFVCSRVAEYAHAESAVGSAAMRWLRRADLGTKKIAYRAQNLFSLLRAPTVPRNRAANVRVTEPPNSLRPNGQVAPKLDLATHFATSCRVHPFNLKRLPH